MRLLARHTVVAASLLLLGCSQAPTARVPARDPATPVVLPPQTLPAPVPAIPGQDPVRLALSTLAAGISQTTSFEAQYVNEERQAGERRRSAYTMKFQQQPRVSLLEVLDSTAIPRGFKVRDTGGDKVRVRLPGAVSFISMEVPARSSQSRGLLGLYPDQVTPERFLATLVDPASAVREVPGRVMDGRALRCFEAQGPRSPLPGATVLVGLGEGPSFAYYMALARPNGDTQVQTFTRFKVRTFRAGELDL